MSLFAIQDSTLTDIADAIREKTGKSASMTPLEMPEEIESISGGGSTWETIFSQNGVYIDNDAGGGYYYGTIPWSEPITLNSEWRVIWDGVSYECTATWEGSPDGSPYAIGNPTFDGGQGGNNEPFLMQMYWGTSLVIVAEVAKSYDIVIQKKTSGGGGLEYEEGTYTAVSDGNPTINFSNSHNSAPIFVMFVDSTGEAQTTTNMGMACVLGNIGTVVSGGIPYGSGTADGVYGALYRGSSSDTGVGGNRSPISNYLTSSNFTPFFGASARTCQSGRTYKWIAVWR